jgi:hypothetical protein
VCGTLRRFLGAELPPKGVSDGLEGIARLQLAA